MTHEICHRVNERRALLQVPQRCGVEIDVRSCPSTGALYLQHDPFAPGEALDAWLEALERRPLAGPLIVNTKEDGLELRLLSLLRGAGIDAFFFLDTTPPTLVRLLQQGLQQHLCQRISCFESSAVLRAYAAGGLPTPAWVWADCFFAQPPSPQRLQALGRVARVCLVSPELQGAAASRIDAFLPLRRWVHAVCTKHIERWRQAA